MRLVRMLDFEVRGAEGSTLTLQPGMVLALDGSDPGLMFEFGSTLISNGREVRVLARQPVEDLVRGYGLPPEACRWITERSGVEGGLEPNLEVLRRHLDLEMGRTSGLVLILEGFEYLAGVNGEDRLIEFLRAVIDHVRLEDDLLLIAVDLGSFQTKHRHHLTRDLDIIDASHLRSWIDDPASIADHPFMRIRSRKAEVVVPEVHGKASDLPLSPELERPSTEQEPTQVPGVDDQLASMMMTWARESSTEEDANPPAPAVERPQVHDPDPTPPRIRIPETAPVVRKGPRTALHIRRNRPPSPIPIKDHELDRDGWRAAGHRADEVPSLDPMLPSPPSHIPPGREVLLDLMPIGAQGRPSIPTSGPEIPDLPEIAKPDLGVPRTHFTDAPPPAPGNRGRERATRSQRRSREG